MGQWQMRNLLINKYYDPDSPHFNDRVPPHSSKTWRALHLVQEQTNRQIHCPWPLPCASSSNTSQDKIGACPVHRFNTLDRSHAR